MEINQENKMKKLGLGGAAAGGLPRAADGEGAGRILVWPRLAAHDDAGLAGLKVRCLSPTRGLCRCRGRCRGHGGCLGSDEGAGLVRCLVENTRGLCRCRGRCRAHGGCLGWDEGADLSAA